MCPALFLLAIDYDIKKFQRNKELCVLGFIDCAIYKPILIYRDTQLIKKPQVFAGGFEKTFKVDLYLFEVSCHH